MKTDDLLGDYGPLYRTRGRSATSFLPWNWLRRQVFPLRSVNSNLPFLELPVRATRAADMIRTAQKRKTFSKLAERRFQLQSQSNVTE